MITRDELAQEEPDRAMEAMLRMKKIDIRELERAVAGEGVRA